MKEPALKPSVALVLRRAEVDGDVVLGGGEGEWCVHLVVSTQPTRNPLKTMA